MYSISSTQKYKDYLASEKWRIFSIDAKLATGGRCQGCDRKTWRLHVHHLTYERLGDERSSDVWVVCPSCHLKFHPHHKRAVNKERRKRGQKKIRGRLGVPKGYQHPRRKKALGIVPKKAKNPGWSDAERLAIADQVQRKLGRPRPNPNDFRNKLFA